MKTPNVCKVLAVALVGAWGLSTAVAQDTGAITASTQVSPQTPVHLDYAASEVAKLSQAKVNDDTIVSYINSSANLYNLNADQIIYLRQLGASDVVIKAMLAHPLTASAGQPASSSVSTAYVPTPSTPAPAPVATTTTVAPVVVTQPSVTYVQTVPSTYYYSSPYYYGGYPYYGYYGYPGVSLSFGWGGRWGGGGWRGGGGWHGGGGGGGWHGGGGGHH